jgi:hypothetical protein
VGATWWISDDVCHISIVLFCKYTNHVSVSHTARTNYGDECDLPPTIRMPSIFGKKNSFGEERIGLVFVMILHMHVYEADEFGKNRLNQ